MLDFSMISNKVKDCFIGLEGNHSILIKGPDGDITLQSEQPVSSASIIKIPIMIEALYQADNGRIHLDDTIMVENHNCVQGSGVLSHLSIQDGWKVSDLIILMIISSDNTATNQLIDLLGISSINSTMRKLGCYHSTLMRKMMDHESLKLGKDNLMCASDTVTLLQAIHSGNMLSNESKEWALSVLTKQQFQDKFPSKIAHLSEGELAHKTGELEGIEHDVGILFTQHGPVFYAFLTAGLIENRYGRDAIANAGRLLYDYYSEKV
ncbi:serine hydrolase [Alkalihalobacillus sp. CinArs1]|uniref:serine hydrolase n=1 Tax=Alkalihalobacillus sp. CinArs1 TaxID=2995314 RepID=UPI0022DD9BBF|nr:serine hydrolase [Alkalihalobacillus sp. CinArs1]